MSGVLVSKSWCGGASAGGRGVLVAHGPMLSQKVAIGRTLTLRSAVADLRNILSKTAQRIE